MKNKVMLSFVLGLGLNVGIVQTTFARTPCSVAKIVCVTKHKLTPGTCAYMSCVDAYTGNQICL